MVSKPVRDYFGWETGLRFAWFENRFEISLVRKPGFIWVGLEAGLKLGWFENLFKFGLVISLVKI